MDKKRILQYQKKYAQEKKDNKSRNLNPKNVLNTPAKNKKETHVKFQNSKKNPLRSIEQKEYQPKVIETNYKQKAKSHHNNFINNTNININLNSSNSNQKQYNQNYVMEKNKNDQLNEPLYTNYNNDKPKNFKSFNYNDKITYKFSNRINRKSYTKKIKDDNYNYNYNNNDNDNDTISDKSFNQNIYENNNYNNNKNSSIKSLRTSNSLTKINLPYTKFINNLKVQMENYEENERQKNKKINQKNLFSNFLNQFINKNKKKIYYLIHL